MADQLTKLRPDRDLQCYFQEPTAVAALSCSSPTGFAVTGCWRQQFDWAVLEWNRDNVFEHPALRNLPDGDLSGVRLSYQESRTNCIPIDSTTYDSIGWSYLRIWEESGGGENYHQVPLKPQATPIDPYVQPTAQFQLQGTLTPGDYIDLAWLDQHISYQIAPADTLATAAAALAGATGAATGVTAAASGAVITLTYVGAPGSNGNRVGVYATTHNPQGAATESWSPTWAVFMGGVSPQRWQVSLDFSNLTGDDGKPVTTTNVRKLRWTWSADLQPASFQRSEFAVLVSNWQVTGTNLTYSVAGPGSRRIEDTAPEVSYTGAWTEERGNYSGGSIRHTTTPGAALRITYTAAYAHTLYLGTRYWDHGAQIAVQVDSGAPITVNLKRALEDVLIRVPLGQWTGQHTVTVTHTGASGTDVYFDFLEIAVPVTALPVFRSSPTTTLATDWDTNHSLALAPERTAWLISTLGFNGRANHYAGALWFYELVSAGNQYATAAVTFSGAPQFGGMTQITLGGNILQHWNLIGDTAATVALCFALWINAGSSAVWAQANGATLTITARAMGTDGNGISVAASTGSIQFTAAVSGATGGGMAGTWHTDLTAVPRMNRAARDWTREFCAALKGYGIAVAASFSTELGNGDDSPAAGIAQRYTDGPCWVNTPALQTNFSPTSITFWQQVYLDMADVMTSAGVTPYLQFGEIQWWYFADGHPSMPFYDAYTQSTFQAAYGRQMAVIPNENVDPGAYSQECAFLAGLIGTYTQAIMAFVRKNYANANFEVLYPPDVNNTNLNRLMNFPASQWTPANLACLKTENFTYTGDRILDLARTSIALPMSLGFAPSQASHLVGIGDYTTPWDKERRLALGAGLESVVLFALDQFCLVGYDLPLGEGMRRARFLGK